MSSKQLVRLTEVSSAEELQLLWTAGCFEESISATIMNDTKIKLQRWTQCKLDTQYRDVSIGRVVPGYE